MTFSAEPPPVAEPEPSDVPPLPLLVTGISGVAGYNAFLDYRSRFPGRVIGIRPGKTSRLTGTGIVPMETDAEGDLDVLFRAHRFRSVLNTTGDCNLKSCELDHEKARRVNVRSAACVVGCARRWGARLVHLSSDLVFSGAGGGDYLETDATDPVTVYGATMVEAERAVLAVMPGAAVLRISLPMGPSFNHHAGAIDWIQSRFRAGRPATLYVDEVRSATYTDDLNRVFARFLAGNDHGVYHAGGPRALTLFQIAQVINRIGGYDPGLLRGCPRADAGPLPPRAGNVSLRSDKLMAVVGGGRTGVRFRPWPDGDALVPTHDRWHLDRPAGEPRSFRRLVECLYHSPAGPLPPFCPAAARLKPETAGHIP